MKVRLRDLQATAAIALLVMSGNIQMAGAQAATATAGRTDGGGPNLPAAPAPKLTGPLYLRDTGQGLHAAASILSQSAEAVHADRCSVAAAGEYAAAGLPAARREDLSEPVGRGDCWRWRTTSTLRLRGSIWTLRTRTFCEPRQGRGCAASRPGWWPTRWADRARRSRAAAGRAEPPSGVGRSGAGRRAWC